MRKKLIEETYLLKLEEYGLSDMSLDSWQHMRFHAGDIISQEGMPISWIAIVVSGHAKVCSTAPNGKNLILSHYISNGLLGDVEFITGLKTAAATVVASTELECIMVPYHGYETELKSNAVFLNKLSQELARKMLCSSDNYVAAALCTGEERLCNYILQASHNNIFNDVLTDTACSIGMSYRHMLRLLNQLCMEGILEKRESGYHILDWNGLLQRGSSPYHRQIENSVKRQAGPQ